MENKHLTVIVPVFKVEQYLPKCLDSLINQTFKNLSIICVNDGSPDRCGEILADYAARDSRVHVVTTENGGLWRARNVGLEYLKDSLLSAGTDRDEYVTFIDSDDYMDLGAYETAIGCFSSEVDLVCFGYKSVDLAGNKLKEFMPNTLGISGATEVTKEIISNIAGTVWSNIYRANIVFDNNIKFPAVALYEDNFFSQVYLLFAKNIYFCNKPFYSYLIRDDSIMGQKKSKRPGYVVSFIPLIDQLLDFLKSADLLESRNHFFWDFFYRLLIQSISQSPNQEEEDLLYKKADDTLATVEQKETSLVWQHFNELIKKRDFKEYRRTSFAGLLKQKHRPSYDKYYILGIPVLQNTYTSNKKQCKLFGLFNV